ERFDDRAVGFFGDFRIDLPLFLNDTDGALGVFLGVSKPSIESSHTLFDSLRVLLDALLGGGVAIARELDDVADKRDFVESFALEDRDGGHGNDDRSDRAGS